MTNLLLFLILAVLIFGAGAVLGFFSFIFWLVIICVIIFAFLRGIASDIERQKELAEKKKLEEEYDSLHPYEERKTWFGATIRRIDPNAK